MSDSTGANITLAAGGLAFANEFLGGDLNWRIAVATPVASLFVYGVSKVSEPIGTGLGLAMLVTVIMVPFKGQSPMQRISNLAGGSKK